MKKILGLFVDNPRRAAMALFAVLVTGAVAWFLLVNPAALGIAPFEKNPQKAKTVPPGPSLPDYSKTAEANFADEATSRPTAVQQLSVETPTTAPSTTVLILVGQYCHGGMSFTNSKFAQAFIDSINWSGPGNQGAAKIADFVFGRQGTTYFSPEGTGLELSSPQGANPAIQMSCSLSATSAHEALLTCTGPPNSSVPILVGGIPVAVSFMDCDKPERELNPDEPCASRTCR